MNRPEWLQLALRRSTVTRAVCLTLIVGVVLIAINHGAAILRGNVPLARWLQMALTAVVPYLVSTFSTVQATMELRRGVGGEGAVAGRTSTPGR